MSKTKKIPKHEKCWNCSYFKILTLEHKNTYPEYKCLKHLNEAEISDPKWQVCGDFKTHSELYN